MKNASAGSVGSNPATSAITATSAWAHAVANITIDASRGSKRATEVPIERDGQHEDVHQIRRVALVADHADREVDPDEHQPGHDGDADGRPVRAGPGARARELEQESGAEDEDADDGEVHRSPVNAVLGPAAGVGDPELVTENISANGVIEFIDDWFDPADQDNADDLFAVMNDQMATEEALLLGRKTFEDFRGYWPLQTDDASGSAEHLNRVRKYVVSSTMSDPAWANSTVLSGRLEDEVAALKAQGDGGELGVTGSISVVHALMRANLVDEFRLFVYPVLSSRGRNLMPSGLTPQGLTLAECTSFRSGVVLQVYTQA